jgi:cadmium resistance protein CadD (predicted permease)
VAHLVGVVVTAIGAFVGTNIDDFVVLLLFALGMSMDGIRRWQIVSGQYLGFCALLVISGVGAVALRTVAERWVGLLAIIPLALGLRGFVRAGRGLDSSTSAPVLAGNVATVTIVTIANGGDNVSVYVLLFRQLDLASAIVTVLVFLILLGGLCAAALAVARQARLVPGIVRWSQWLTPFVFIIIGLLVLIRAGTFTHLT